jgi:putative SOS response-associated peptidase YedK
MCNRYSLHRLQELRQRLADLDLELPDGIRPRYNVPVSSVMPVVTEQRGARAVQPLTFGLLLPPREPGGQPLTIANAQAETMREKSAFRDAARHRRCLVPADGFYEWQHVGPARLPHYFQRAGGAPFFFAGLWRPETALARASFVIVTTAPNELVGAVHDRMPVLLTPETATAWLGDAPLDRAAADALCRPFPAAEMTAHRVDPRMNSPRVEDAACIAPWTPPPPEPTLFD